MNQGMKRKQPASKVTPEKLESLKQEMLRNLSDPAVQEQIEGEREERERRLRELANRIGTKNS